MFEPLNGPSKQLAVTVSNTVATEVKVSATPLEDRRVITIQPQGHIKVYFADDNEVPTAATVIANGFKHSKNAIRSYEASDTQAVFIASDTGANVTVVFAERA